MLKQGLLVILVIICMLHTLIYAQDPVAKATQEPTIKISSELVSLDMQVLSKKTGTPFGGLTADNFEIYENNVKQKITNFSQDKLPLSVLLLVDVSGSVEPIIAEIQAGALKALQLLKPEDEVGVMIFASETAALDKFSKDKKLITDSISKLVVKKAAVGQLTFLNEALYQASDYMKKLSSPNYRRVIIVVTDDIINKPTGGHTKDETIKRLLEADITVCGLQVGNREAASTINVKRPNERNPSGINSQGKAPAPNLNGRGPRQNSKEEIRGGRATTIVGDFNELTPPPLVNSFDRAAEKVSVYADETGGEVTDTQGHSIVSRFTDLIEHLRARYSVAYAPDNTKADGKLRKIKVKVVDGNKENKELIVRAKRGYFVNKEK